MNTVTHIGYSAFTDLDTQPDLREPKPPYDPKLLLLRRRRVNTMRRDAEIEVRHCISAKTASVPNKIGVQNLEEIPGQ